MMSSVGGLPHTWCNAKISEIASVNPALDKSGISDDLDVSFVPMSAVQAESGVIDVSNKRKFSDVKKGYTPFREGDVLFAKITPCMENGKMAVVPEVRNGIGFGSTEFHVLRALSGVDAKYVYYYVSSQGIRREAEHNMSGAVGQRRVTTPYLSGCEVPLPPTNEQHRIVAKIEELFSELDKGIENLKTAHAQLKVYRQALLKHAFEGKLTAQWRAENQDKLESAEALLKCIQTERAQHYQQQLADWEASGKQGPKPKTPKTLPPLTTEELAELPELPKGWGWVHLEFLVTGIDQGWSPKCENLPASEAEWGVIKTTAIQHGCFLDKENKALPNNLQPREQHRLNVDDILITRAGPRVRVGVCCLVRKVRENLMNCDKVYRIRSVNTICRPDYMEGVLNSPRILDEIEKIKSGINDSGVNLNQGAFLRLAIPHCSMPEQELVMMELERKLFGLTQLDQTITTSLQQAEALRQSILKKAFSGQLVPQDPHDEPASALLARIKAERATVAKSAIVVAKSRKTAGRKT